MSNSIKNSFFSIGCQAVNTLMNFLVRFVFIKCLPIDYLGLNGLFTNILMILSLAELGIGTAIVYSMYKPIATNDKKKISILMKLYAKIYNAIGIFILIIGVCLIPFLDIFIKNQPNINGLIYIYLMFLLDTVLSYFFSYKRSLITADQKEYILSIIRSIFIFIKTILQIVILLITKNYFLYLGIQIITTLCENLMVSYIVDKKYSYLKEYNGKLTQEETKEIVDNVKALFIYKFATVFLGGIDNLVISMKLGITWVAKYSNYTLIINAIFNIINMFISSITASIGNFIVLENDQEQELLLERISFAVFLIFGFCSTCLYCLLNPFIIIYCGEEYLLHQNVVILIIINFYIQGMMTPIWTFRTTKGLFVQGRWRPIISAMINFILSFILADYLGIAGIILATIIARVVTNLWFDPYIIYKKGWNKLPTSYYKKFLLYTFLLFLEILMVSVIISLFDISYLLGGFVIRTVMVVFLGLIFAIIILFYHNDKVYYINLIKKFIIKRKIN